MRLDRHWIGYRILYCACLDIPVIIPYLDVIDMYSTLPASVARFYVPRVLWINWQRLPLERPMDRALSLSGCLSISLLVKSGAPIASRQLALLGIRIRETQQLPAHGSRVQTKTGAATSDVPPLHNEPSYTHPVPVTLASTFASSSPTSSSLLVNASYPTYCVFLVFVAITPDTLSSDIALLLTSTSTYHLYHIHIPDSRHLQHITQCLPWSEMLQGFWTER
jgi:hypothetical protein